MKVDLTKFEQYYLENGMIVFTEKHHIKRGSCCGNKCRHCPYEPLYQKGNKKLQQQWEKINQQSIGN